MFYVKQLLLFGDQGFWYYCNDSYIDRVNVFIVLILLDVYMLFYKCLQQEKILDMKGYLNIIDFNVVIIYIYKYFGCV